MTAEQLNFQRILQLTTCIAVVGISAEVDRPSFGVAKYMQQHGYRIIPINPKYAEVLGELCYPSLSAIPPDIAQSIQLVNVFRKTMDVLPIAKEALSIGALCLWQQLQIENHQASQLFVDAGKDAVMNRCLKIEHAKLASNL